MNFTDTESNQRGFLVFRSWKIDLVLRKNQFAKSY
jgi:hypothetical protein